MSYDECPRCGDNHAVEHDPEVVQCRSCQIPLASDWLTENFTVHENWSEAP